MKKTWITLAVALQVLSVAWIALDRELILLTGKAVTMQTAPIDPRDIFRGDYVSLSYLFNRIPPELADADIRANGAKKEEAVYLLLSHNREKPAYPATALRLQRKQPDEGVFLKGRITSDWEATTRVYINKKYSEQANTQPLQIRYGIERYYVQQGKGKEIETIQGMHNPRRERYQRPMLIHARVNGSGKAGIEGFSWGNFAFKTDIIKSPDPKAEDDQASAVMGFSIRNVSDAPLTLPLKPGNCSFELRPSEVDFDPDKKLKNGRNECKTFTAAPRLINPGESYNLQFDLNNPAWVFESNDKELPLGKLPWNNRLRIHYIENVDALDTTIISRAFHGRGNID